MIIGDTTTAGLHAALRGLDARRSAYETNIANVETPGYKARSVQFESALRNAIEDGQPFEARHTVEVSSEFGRANGNNVNVDQEMVGLTETALTQELVIRALNDKYNLIRDAIRLG